MSAFTSSERPFGAHSNTDFRKRPLTSQPPERMDRVLNLLSSIGMTAQPAPGQPHTLSILLDGEPRFRLVAPPISSFMMLVADVFTGNENEIGQMAPSLLHANYTCQRLALENPFSVVSGRATSEDEDMQWLPVMGLDIERLTVVLSLQIPFKRIEDADFGDFMAGLVDTIAHDAEVLVDQFKSITSPASV